MNDRRRRGGCQVRATREPKAQTEVVGFIFVFGIVFLSISFILFAGLPVLDDARENTQIQRFQTEFALLDQQMRESVYAPGESGASISLSDGRVSVDEGSDSLTMTITYTPNGGAPITTGGIPLGGVEFDADGSRGVAYEGGGVWAKYRNGVSLSTPPEISYTGSTLNMNMMNFTTEFEATGSTTRRFYFSSEGTHRSSDLEKITGHPLEPGELEVSVKSEFSRGWAEYFRKEIAANSGTVDVSVSPSSDDRGYANVTFVTGPPLYSIENALNHSGVPSDDVDIDPDNEVNVTDTRAGDVVLGNYTGTQLDNDQGPPRGIDSLPDAAGACFRSFEGEDLGSVSSPVTSGEYETNNPTEVGGRTFVADGGDIRIHADAGVTLPAGSTTTFDTSGGDVEVHVSGELEMNGGVEVNGTNSVYFYVQDSFDASGGSSVEIEDGRTKGLQVLTSEDADINNADYTGAVYAVGGIDIQPNSEVTGAAVSVDELRMVGSPPGNNADYAHDTALRGAAPDCADAPLRNLNAVERRVAVR